MILIKNIEKVYQNIKIGKVSFSVKRGYPFALLGRNGSGKSTILKIILGLKTADYGEVSLPKNISIGYLPEERGLFLDSTVQEHFELFARLSHVKNRKKRIDHWLDRLDIKDFANISLKNLSKGTAQKVQIGITFIGNPELIILDEPFSGLDPVNTELLKKLIIEESKNKFIIISSHQMNQIEEICKEAIFIKAGKIVDQGEILDLKKKYGDNRLTIELDQSIQEKLEEHNIIYNLVSNHIKISIQNREQLVLKG